MKYLLDSNIVVAAIKGRLPVAVKLSAMRPGDIAVSIVAKMEAEMALRGDTRAQSRYGRLLRDFLANVRVLDFGVTEAQQAVTLGGYQRQGGNYRWDFPLGQEIFRADDWQAKVEAAKDGRINLATHPITANNAYDAEGAFSPDGEYVLASSAYGDGYGITSLSVLDADTGDLVATFTQASDTQVNLMTVVWESADTVVAVGLEGTTVEGLRFGVDGDLRIVMREEADSLATVPTATAAPATIPKLR